jgi:hypothetical protein
MRGTGSCSSSTGSAGGVPFTTGDGDMGTISGKGISSGFAESLRVVVRCVMVPLRVLAPVGTPAMRETDSWNFPSGSSSWSVASLGKTCEICESEDGDEGGAGGATTGPVRRRVVALRGMTTGEVKVSVSILVTDRSIAVTGEEVRLVGLRVVTLPITDSGKASLSVDTRVIGLSEPGSGVGE